MKDSRLKRNIEGLILGILLLIPCFSVLGRVLYTQWNQNAKDSYYSNTINQYVDTYLTNDSELSLQQVYFLDTSNVSVSSDDSSTYNLYVSEFKLVSYFNLSSSSLDIVNNYSLYRLYFRNYQSFSEMGCYYYDDDNVSHWGFAVRITPNSVNYVNLVMSFKLSTLNTSGTNSSNFLLNYKSTLFTRVYTPNTFLDNAFDTSLYLIVDKYGVGNINFLNWFGNLMFTNPSTLLYCQFANLYLNYCLYINVGYLIYYFFTFFIKMIRRLLDSFIDRRF